MLTHCLHRKLGDSCSEENIFKSFSGTGVVAIDKEPGSLMQSCIIGLAVVNAMCSMQRMYRA